MESLLNNNSSNMKTVVETFIIEETSDLIYDNDKLDQWKELVTELGLKGQNAITKTDKSPIPFMHLKSSMVNVFNILCPRTVDVENYDITPIPLEILSLVKLSKDEGYFEKIQIWYDDKKPDPVCVGIKTLYGPSGHRVYNSYEEAKAEHPKTNTWEYTSNHYLLGKWGDVKHSFETLIEMAKTRWMKEERTRLENNIADSTASLEKLIQESENRFN